MEEVTANLAGDLRRETIHHRQYLVAPLTMIVPGVLNGSRGPLYYPPHEVARRYDAWNGMPMVKGHPKRDGVHVSARHPDVIRQYGLGTVYNTTFGGTLRAEGWFDVDAVKRVDGSILANLEARRPVELSTGLFTKNLPAANGATDPATGRPYVAIATDYQPDHLAILLDGKGACSLKDGCGVFNHDGGSCQCGGTCGRCGAGYGTPAEKAAEYLRLSANALRQGDTDRAQGYAAAAYEMWRAAGLLANGKDDESKAMEQVAVQYATRRRRTTADVANELMVVPEAIVANAASDNLDMTPEKACLILKDGSVKGHRLTKRQRGMFGALCGKRRRPTKNSRTPPPTLDPTGDFDMPLNADQKKTISATLATNCSCGSIDMPWKGKSVDDLAGLPDDVLNGYYQIFRDVSNNPVLRGLRDGITDANGHKVSFNPTSNQFEVRLKDPALANGVPVGNNMVAKPANVREWLAIMPPDAAPVWQTANELHDQAKRELIGRLTENMSPEQRAQAEAVYNTMDPSHLKTLVAALPPKQQAQPTGNGTTPVAPTNFFGAAGGVPLANANAGTVLQGTVANGVEANRPEKPNWAGAGRVKK